MENMNLNTIVEFEQNRFRDYNQDLVNSNNPALRASWTNLFKIKFGDDCLIHWKDNKEDQLNFGTDIIIKTKQGRRFSIELKTRNIRCLNNPNFIMEIVSHIYNKPDALTRVHIKKKEGWIYSTTAEYIFHATINENKEILEAIFYTTTPFKLSNYKSEFNKYQTLWLPTLFQNGQFQLTLNRLIPKEVIKRDAMEFWEWKK